MSNKRARNVQINYEVLKKEAKKKGINGAELSRMLGRNESWLSQQQHNVRKGQKVREYDYFVEMIEKMTGIPKEKFVITGEPAEKAKQPELSQVNTITSEQANRIIDLLTEISAQLLILPKISDTQDSTYCEIADATKTLDSICARIVIPEL